MGPSVVMSPAVPSCARWQTTPTSTACQGECQAFLWLAATRSAAQRRPQAQLCVAPAREAEQQKTGTAAKPFYGANLLGLLATANTGACSQVVRGLCKGCGRALSGVHVAWGTPVMRYSRGRRILDNCGDFAWGCGFRRSALAPGWLEGRSSTRWFGRLTMLLSYHRWPAPQLAPGQPITAGGPKRSVRK